MSKKYSFIFFIFALLAHPIFPALEQGTLVHTANGPTPIEQLAAGDTVLSRHGNEIISNRIIKTFAHQCSNGYYDDEFIF
jgi:hypothetical protein